MNKHSKISAFTLSEMMVVLVITSIVVGIAFSVLTLVTKQFKAIEHSYDLQTQLTMFKEQLALDFDKCQAARLDSINQYLSLETNEGLLQYNFEDSQIIRAQDRFSLSYNDMNFYFQGVERKNGLVDAMSVTIKLPGKPIHVFVQRRASAKEKILTLWE